MTTTDIAIFEDREGQVLFPVRCRGCGQAMGWGSYKDPGISLYCSSACAWEGPLGITERRNERRNDHIRNAHRCYGWTPTKVAMHFGISRQRVNQLLYPEAKDAQTG
jgi:hypothetical protein